MKKLLLFFALCLFSLNSFSDGEIWRDFGNPDDGGGCDSSPPYQTTHFSSRIDRDGPGCVFQCMNVSSWSCTYINNWCQQC